MRGDHSTALELLTAQRVRGAAHELVRQRTVAALKWARTTGGIPAVLLFLDDEERQEWRRRIMRAGGLEESNVQVEAAAVAHADAFESHLLVGGRDES